MQWCAQKLCTELLTNRELTSSVMAPVLHRTTPGGYSAPQPRYQGCGSSLYRCQVPMGRWQALFQTFLWLKSHKPHHSKSQRAEQLQGWFPGVYSAAQAASLGLSAPAPRAGTNSWGWNHLADSHWGCNSQCKMTQLDWNLLSNHTLSFRNVHMLPVRVYKCWEQAQTSGSQCPNLKENLKAA